MSKSIFFLEHDTARNNAIQCVQQAPDGYCVEVKQKTRTMEQNAKFHALCSDLEKAGAKWAGKPRSLIQWKVLLVSGHSIATGIETEFLLGLEGEFVNIRESTAQMGTKRLASLIEYTQAYCANNSVVSQ